MPEERALHSHPISLSGGTVPNGQNSLSSTSQNQTQGSANANGNEPTLTSTPTPTPNFTGRYRLDKENSDSLQNHFKAMPDSNEVICLATTQLVLELEIVHTLNFYTVFQRSQVGHTKRTLRITPTHTNTHNHGNSNKNNGTETVITQETHPTQLASGLSTSENPGIREVTVEPQPPDSMLLTTKLPNNEGIIITRQTLSRDRNSFTSDILLRTGSIGNGTGKEVRTKRRYIRVGDVSPELIKEHQECEKSGKMSAPVHVSTSSLRSLSMKKKPKE